MDRVDRVDRARPEEELRDRGTGRELVAAAIAARGIADGMGGRGWGIRDQGLVVVGRPR